MFLCLFCYLFTEGARGTFHQFPIAHLVDVLGFVYPQYWTNNDCNNNLDKHLKIVKAHYGHLMLLITTKFPEGSIDLILSPGNLDM